jgi:glutaminyl-peptide cyclotransferase
LAEEWEFKTHSALSTYKTALNSISLFLLLDLLGAADPNIQSYFETTHWAYQGLANIESRLRSLELLQSKPKHVFLPDGNKVASSFSRYSGIQDDHVPFMIRGVEILHIIPSPFPQVWHKVQDDGEHLDLPTVEDWARIVTAFVGEWMDLEGHFPPKTEAEAKAKGKRADSSKTEL